MDIKIFLVIGIVIACCDAKKKPKHHHHKMKMNKDGYNMKKAFKHCIGMRKADPTSDNPSDCMKHHDHSMGKYAVPNQDKLDQLKCYYASYKECRTSGGENCFIKMVTKVKQAKQGSVKGKNFFKKWISNLPMMLRRALILVLKCYQGKNCRGTVESRQKRFEYIQLQICAYQISHCKENNLDDATCKKNWQECLSPSSCDKPTTYQQLSSCSEEATSEGIVTCMLALKDPHLPTKHCREKICYERASEAENFGETWESCMAVNKKMKKPKVKNESKA